MQRPKKNWYNENSCSSPSPNFSTVLSLNQFVHCIIMCPMKQTKQEMSRVLNTCARYPFQDPFEFSNPFSVFCVYDNTHAIFTFFKYTFFINQTAIPIYIALCQKRLSLTVCFATCFCHARLQCSRWGNHIWDHGGCQAIFSSYTNFLHLSFLRKISITVIHHADMFSSAKA